MKLSMPAYTASILRPRLLPSYRWLHMNTTRSRALVLNVIDSTFLLLNASHSDSTLFDLPVETDKRPWSQVSCDCHKRSSKRNEWKWCEHKVGWLWLMKWELSEHRSCQCGGYQCMTESGLVVWDGDLYAWLIKLGTCHGPRWTITAVDLLVIWQFLIVYKN